MPKITKGCSTMGLPLKTTRNPKCARCRNHEFIVSLKGHVGKCPFSQCSCWKCALITERTKIMAVQRRLKKNRSEEIEAWERPGYVNVCDLVADEPLDAQKESAHASVQMSPGPAIRVETVIKVPPLRSEEARGKTYAELEVQNQDKSTREGPWIIREPSRDNVKLHSSPPMDNVKLYSSDHMHWNGTQQQDPPVMMGRNASNFSPGPEYVIAEFAQRDVFSGEMMAMPMPLGLFSHINNGYAAWPTFLVNMPPQSPQQGSFKSGHGPMVFQHFPPRPGTILYHPEATPTNSGGLSSQDFRAPFLAPLPTICPRGIPEELAPRMHLQPPPQTDREYGAERHILGSQGSEGISVENDSQEIM